jgi:nitrate/nitrite transport system ATP-binding protein
MTGAGAKGHDQGAACDLAAPLLEVDAVEGRAPLGGSSGRSASFTLRAGEIGVLLGGRDVSVLIRIILGLGELTRGEIRFRGRRVFPQRPGAMDLAHYRQRIGFAFRDKGLLANLDVRDNVDLPAKYHGYYDDAKKLEPYALAERALEVLGIPEAAWEARPARLGNVLRKKALFARAIVLTPDLLVMDDPTSLVDSPDLVDVLRFIKGQAREAGRGVLLATNDYPAALAVADWVRREDTGAVVQGYLSFLDPVWLQAAALLKQRLSA